MKKVVTTIANDSPAALLAQSTISIRIVAASVINIGQRFLGLEAPRVCLLSEPTAHVLMESFCLFLDRRLHSLQTKACALNRIMKAWRIGLELS